MKKNVTMLVLSMLALSLSGQTSSVSQTSSSKTSIAVDKSNERYFYTSHFDAAKTNTAKTIIIKNLGAPNDDNMHVAFWKQKGINASISQGIVKIEIYYDKADQALISKVERMADVISKTNE